MDMNPWVLLALILVAILFLPAIACAVFFAWLGKDHQRKCMERCKAIEERQRVLDARRKKIKSSRRYPP